MIVMQCSLLYTYAVVIPASTSGSIAMEIVTSTESTCQNESWNENSSGSGLSTELSTAPREAEKLAADNNETFAEYSDTSAIPVVWLTLQAKHVTSKNFDTSTAATNDVGPTSVTGKLDIRSSPGYSRGPDGDDFLYSSSETATTQMPNSRHQSESVSDQLEEFLIQSTNATTTHWSFSDNSGMKSEHLTTRQLVNTLPAHYQMQLDSDSSRSSSGGGGGEGSAGREETGGSDASAKPRDRNVGPVDNHPSSRDSSQHLTRSSSQQERRHDAAFLQNRDDDTNHHDEVRMN